MKASNYQFNNVDIRESILQNVTHNPNTFSLVRRIVYKTLKKKTYTTHLYGWYLFCICTIVDTNQALDNDYH